MLRGLLTEADADGPEIVIAPPFTSLDAVASGIAGSNVDLAAQNVNPEEKGAFTGALARKRGRFERAHGGTILLDEIGEMAPHIQPKILRAAEDGLVQRLGSSHTAQVDVRLVSATNQDLDKLVQQRKFRKDLFYRLQFAHLGIPRLRDRLDDIPLLAEHFVGGSQLGDDTYDVLDAHDWPGNVRELANVLEHATSFPSVAQIELEPGNNGWA